MRILFINAQDTKGGGSLAPYRLSKALEKQYQTENYFIVGKKHSADANVFCTRKNEIQLYVEVFIDKVMNKLGLQYRYFPFSTRFILKKVKELKPDIISLHNTHEGYFKTALLKKLSKLAPIAWTLHDMWSFTGNAVHTFGDESWKQMKTGKGEKRVYPHIGIDTGRWLLKQKRRIYRKSKFHVVAPSNWIATLAKQSPVFENKSVHMIHHGLDLDFFKPRDRTACRKVLGISPNANVLVFSSAGDLDNCPWKGGKLLIDILKQIDRETPFPIELLAIGKGELKALTGVKNLKIHRVGYVSSQQFMTQLLSAADLFIYPTKADTAPLVLMETIACGTPAVTFNIGGCSDMIRDEVSGIVVEPFEIDTFVTHTINLLKDENRLQKLSISARQLAENDFDIKDMANKHYELFKRLTA